MFARARDDPVLLPHAALEVDLDFGGCGGGGEEEKKKEQENAERACDSEKNDEYAGVRTRSGWVVALWSNNSSSIGSSGNGSEGGKKEGVDKDVSHNEAKAEGVDSGGGCGGATNESELWRPCSMHVILLLHPRRFAAALSAAAAAAAAVAGENETHKGKEKQETEKQQQQQPQSTSTSPDPLSSSCSSLLSSPSSLISSSSFSSSSLSSTSTLSLASPHPSQSPSSSLSSSSSALSSSSPTSSLAASVAASIHRREAYYAFLPAVQRVLRDAYEQAEAEVRSRRKFFQRQLQLEKTQEQEREATTLSRLQGQQQQQQQESHDQRQPQETDAERKDDAPASSTSSSTSSSSSPCTASPFASAGSVALLGEDDIAVREYEKMYRLRKQAQGGRQLQQQQPPVNNSACGLSTAPALSASSLPVLMLGHPCLEVAALWAQRLADIVGCTALSPSAPPLSASASPEIYIDDRARVLPEHRTMSWRRRPLWKHEISRIPPFFGAPPANENEKRFFRSLWHRHQKSKANSKD